MANRLARLVCRWLGHARDWPEMETCGRCGVHMPLYSFPPIEHDESYNRDYIPVGAGWEIQTKGKGSTFRICDKEGDRLAIPDSPYLHETLTRMAREIHAERTAFPLGVVAEEKEPDSEAKTLAEIFQWWLKFNADGHEREGMPVNDGMHVIPPHWPTRGALKKWIEVLERLGNIPRRG